MKKFDCFGTTREVDNDFENLSPKLKHCFLVIAENLPVYQEWVIATKFKDTGTHTRHSKKTLYRYTSEEFDIIFHFMGKTMIPLNFHNVL